MEILPSAHMDSRDTLADGGPCWVSFGQNSTLAVWDSDAPAPLPQIGRRGAGERQEEPAVCFTFVLPPEISSEQRVLKSEMSL